MYFIDEGVKYEVYEGIDQSKDEYVYIIVCSECGDYAVISEYKFIQLVEEGVIDVICEEDGDSDDYYESNDENDLRDDIMEELFALKELMKKHREAGNMNLYDSVMYSYTKLYKLIY